MGSFLNRLNLPVPNIGGAFKNAIRTNADSAIDSAPDLTSMAINAYRDSGEDDTADDPIHGYSEDLSEQIGVKGVRALAPLVPKGKFRTRLEAIAEGTPEQRRSAFRTAVQDAAILGGAASLITGVARGIPKLQQGQFPFDVGAALRAAPFAAIPGAIGGYFSGRDKQRKKEIYNYLKNG